MGYNTYIGADNGCTGSWGIIHPDGVIYEQIPTKKELSYTKKVQHVTRVDHEGLKNLLRPYSEGSICLLERPFTGQAFKTVSSAMRCLESTIIALEALGIPYQYVTSSEWQKSMLPRGLVKKELKKGAVDIARRLFPDIDCGKDADGLLIAEYCRRMYR